jgi:hypothetical protein
MGRCPHKARSIACILIPLLLTSMLAACASTMSSNQSNHPTSSAGQPGSTPSTAPLPRPSATPLPTNGRPIPNFAHIFVVVLENTSYSHIIGSSQAPYINRLASQYGLATQFYAITHPSLPNYFTLTGGSTFGVVGNCALSTPSCPQNAQNIADLIERSGRTWAAYFESMPTACDTRMDLPYTFHLNPFVYYTNIVTHTQRCQSHILPYNQPQFLTELQANTLPNYVWIGPNLLNNIHNGTITQADSWLAANIDPIIASPAFENSLIILTFDEGDDSGSVDRSGCCGYSLAGDTW